MKYLDKVIRRAAGKSLKHTLRPQLSRWSEVSDPFDNASLLPLAYPARVLRATSRPSAAIRRSVKKHSDDGSPFINISPGAPPSGITRKISQQREDWAGESTTTSSPLHRVAESTQKSHGITDERVSTTQIISKSKVSHAFSVDRDDPVAEKKEGSLASEKAGAVRAGPKRSVSIKSSEPSDPRASLEPPKVTLPAVGKGLEKAPIVSQQVARESRSSRRRKARTLSKDTPRVVIGRVTVNVVPVKAPSKPLEKERQVRRGGKGGKSAESSRLARKLGYGIGQM